MAQNELDKLLAQDAPQADTESPMWGMLRPDIEDDDELEFHDGRSTQVGVEEGEGSRRLPLQMPAKVASVEVIDDEVIVGDPRWVWDSMIADNDDGADEPSPYLYHGSHSNQWVGERPERVISQDAEKVYELWFLRFGPSAIAKKLGWRVSRVKAIIAKELNQ